MPHEAVDTGLHHNLLDEPLIRWRCRGKGDVHRASLPELFVAMAANELRDFPALRPHQRHPWHAFLTQLAAIAMHRASQSEPWTTAADWRAALLALTPHDADGAAWCLVSPPDRPALLQAAVPGGIEGWDAEAKTPDRLDMLITSRNHDLKQARMRRASPEEWLFALLSLQTQEGSNSGSYKGVSRMNSGAGSRPGVGAALRDAPGARWRSDVAVLLRTRDKTVDAYGLAGPVALTWLVPWDGAASIPFVELDPHYIEICRRVRLQQLDDRVLARTYKTPTSRIEDSPDRKGRTGDPWTPVNKGEAKILTISGKGFDYELMVELLLGSEYEPAPAQDLSVWPEGSQLELIAQGIARGNSKTSGYHERRVAVAPKLRRLLLSPQRATVAQIAKQRIEAIAALRKLLWSALVVLFANGEGDDRNDSISDKAGRFARPFEQREDARFFPDLSEEVEAEDALRADRRVQWLLGLVTRAEAVLRDAFNAGPRNGMQRYKARAAALSRFHGGLRGPKPTLPDLAHHFRQQSAAAEPLREESSHV
jgi:CRISPR system Cascade subunit CasA